MILHFWSVYYALGLIYSAIRIHQKGGQKALLAVLEDKYSNIDWLLPRWMLYNFTVLAFFIVISFWPMYLVQIVYKYFKGNNK